VVLNDFKKESGIFKQVTTFLASPMRLPPQTSGLDSPLVSNTPKNNPCQKQTAIFYERQQTIEYNYQKKLLCITFSVNVDSCLYINTRRQYVRNSYILCFSRGLAKPMLLFGVVPF